jgi:hypothetical protein
MTLEDVALESWACNADERAHNRARQMWELRRCGWSYRRIAEVGGVSVGRAYDIVSKAERRLARACEHYRAPVNDRLAYHVWHTFTPEDGRVGIK